MKILISISAVYSVDDAERMLHKFEDSGRQRGEDYESRVSNTLYQRVKDAKRRSKTGIKDLKQKSDDQIEKWKNAILRYANRLIEVQSEIQAMEGHRISPLHRANLLREKADLDTRIANLNKMIGRYEQKI